MKCRYRYPLKKKKNLKNIKVGTLFKTKLEKHKGRYRYHLKKNLKNIKLGTLFYKNLKNIQVGTGTLFLKT